MKKCNVYFILSIFLLFQITHLHAASLGDSCLNSSAIGPHCKFYSCIEKKSECGNDGYALGYGKPYCELFASEKRLSSEGKKWRDQTLICLQEKLIPVLFNNYNKCAEIKNNSFNSHTDCYINNGAVSVCNLPLTDKLIILGIIKKDLITYEGLKQSLSTGLSCLKN